MLLPRRRYIPSVADRVPAPQSESVERHIPSGFASRSLIDGAGTSVTVCSKPKGHCPASEAVATRFEAVPAG